ncbi:hypothetical protein KAT36_00765 [Candidatus Pacearchaeota archaeon]|nr:hypothetical protein [Candidatus Pacearchaeota archaeon]
MYNFKFCFNDLFYENLSVSRVNVLGKIDIEKMGEKVLAGMIRFIET